MYQSLAVIGDSITRGSFYENGEWQVACPRFSDILAESLGFTQSDNYGINGVSISRVSPVNREYVISENIANVALADVLIVAGGTNDYGNSVPVGRIEDGEDISFYGGLRVLCERIKKLFSSSLVVFVLPIKRVAETEKNGAGNVLQEYRDAITAVAQEYGFRVIDGKQVSFSPDEEEGRKKYIPDGLHPNDAGHALYGKYLCEKLKELL